ncbi:MAG TPA: hypothetical protein VK631_29460 [Solirubrobacteraceae bacterium]|nr:hypothetical protein [Solirubrobacteraceae bacterium]
MQDVGERWRAPVLVGAGQGGELCLALAVLMPEALAGVVAVDAVVPEVRGWRYPERRSDALPIRLIGPVHHDSVRQLERLGAAVTVD